MDRIDRMLEEFFAPEAPRALTSRVLRALRAERVDLEGLAGKFRIEAKTTRFASLTRCSCAQPRRQTIRVDVQPMIAGVERSSRKSWVFISPPKA